MTMKKTLIISRQKKAISLLNSQDKSPAENNSKVAWYTSNHGNWSYSDDQKLQLVSTLIIRIAKRTGSLKLLQCKLASKAK